MAVVPPNPEVAALAARIERRVNELARTMVRVWKSEIPNFEALPSDMKDIEQAQTARHAIRLFLNGLQHGVDADPQGRQLFRERAAQRAEEGLPLATLLSTYTIGCRVLFEELRKEAGPQEQAALVEVCGLLMAAGAEVMADVVQAYQDELAAIASTHHDRHRALVRDLLAGILPTEPSLLAEFRLTEGAVVLSVRFDDEPSADTASARGPQAEVAVRRRLRRIQGALDRHFGRTVPMLLEADGGHVLVPHALLPAPDGPALDEIAARLAETWPAVRVSAAVANSPREVAAAARTASEVLRLANGLGRPPGAYRLADVLLEFHLTRHDESAELLSGLLAPLSERPELLETLRVFLAENYDRRRAARRLSLHPNTVDNRLARTTELTGLDPSTPRGVTLLMTALALRDLG